MSLSCHILFHIGIKRHTLLLIYTHICEALRRRAIMATFSPPLKRFFLFFMQRNVRGQLVEIFQYRGEGTKICNDAVNVNFASCWRYISFRISVFNKKYGEGGTHARTHARTHTHTHSVRLTD